MNVPEKLLCVAPYVPWSGIDHAGGSYLYHYLREFSHLGWEVQLAAPRSTVNEESCARLQESDPEIVVSMFDVPSGSKVTARLTMLLAGRDGLSPRRWRGAETLAQAARDASIVDLQWHDIYGYASWFARRAPETPLIALAHDLRSQSVARNAAAASGAKRVFLRVATRRVLARERAELAHCDRLLAFKASDLDRARDHGIRAPGLTAPPYVDLAADGVSPQPSSRTMVFPAAFFRSENAEAAHWFLDSVWPVVRAEVPDARIRFAGARPPEDLVARASEDVEFTGYLPSLIDGYRGTLFSVAPLLRGAGLKFKVVQAMALGFPVVGTSVAMEGLEDFLPASMPVVGHDDSQGFAARIVAILRDPSTNLAEAAAVAPTLRARASFGDRMAELSTAYSSVIAERTRRER